jgi:hypothetical protein
LHIAGGSAMPGFARTIFLKRIIGKRIDHNMLFWKDLSYFKNLGVISGMQGILQVLDNYQIIRDSSQIDVIWR